MNQWRQTSCQNLKKVSKANITPANGACLGALKSFLPWWIQFPHSPEHVCSTILTSRQVLNQRGTISLFWTMNSPLPLLCFLIAFIASFLASNRICSTRGPFSSPKSYSRMHHIQKVRLPTYTYETKLLYLSKFLCGIGSPTSSPSTIPVQEMKERWRDKKKKDSIGSSHSIGYSMTFLYSSRTPLSSPSISIVALAPFILPPGEKNAKSLPILTS